MDQPSSPDAPTVSQSRFWVGPLVAGCCFALGYGVTHRVLTFQINAKDPSPESFPKLAFPGDSLQEMRARFQADDAPLEVDVTALEAVEAASRTSKPEVKTTTKPDIALQAPEPPVWTAPAWSDPQTTAPDAQPEMDDSDAEPVVLAEDSAVLAAEPEPVVVPPGAEAFFETVEPVTPPQP